MVVKWSRNNRSANRRVGPFTNERLLSAEELRVRSAANPPAGEGDDEADLIETVRQMVKESGLDAVRRHVENFED
jgi:hypothetical protein